MSNDLLMIPDLQEGNIVAEIPRIGNPTEKSDTGVASVLWRWYLVLGVC